MEWQIHPGAPAEMWNEWQAWQVVVRELRGASASLDINKEDRLNAALVMWGETLADLRCTQDAETRQGAWEAATAKVERHLI